MISGSTMQLRSGRYFHLTNPAASEFDIEDIAHALSNLCRYTGHCRTFYSVAEHSWRASFIVPDEYRLHALLHDAAEAFLGDVASPLKGLVPDYRCLERQVERAVFTHFGLPFPLPAAVKHADLVMLATERRDLMPATPEEWVCLRGVKPQPVQIIPLSPDRARLCFLERFYQLENKKCLSA